MSNWKELLKNFDITRINSWHPVVVLIGGIAVIEIFNLIKPETILFGTIIILSLIGLAGFVVYRATMNKEFKQSENETRAIKLSGHIDCLNDLTKHAKKMKKKTARRFDCECFDKMIDELTGRINAFKSLLK